jgi:hypothetical protein
VPRKNLKHKPRIVESSDGTSIAKSTKNSASLDSRRKANSVTRPRLTLRDLGWTREQAMQVRAKLSTFALDWDDPAMDIYDEA